MTRAGLIFENIVVGAGLAGLSLARALASQHTLVLEKSKGIGGRMATRRNGEFTFDHGAQFYSASEPSAIDELWTEAGLAKVWFAKEDRVFKAAPGGITALAKALIPRERIELGQLVERVSPVVSGWHVLAQGGAEYLGERLILTCPLPQSLEILRRSSIPYNPALDLIAYKKALVGLFALESGSGALENFKYLENVSDQIFSIANQKSKGVSAKLALTVVMQPDWSEQHFSDPEDAAILNLIWSAAKTALKSISADALTLTGAELKKWRYAQPANTFGELFLEPQSHLYLAGDAFGGASLMGAYRSSTALAYHFVTNHRENLSSDRKI